MREGRAFELPVSIGADGGIFKRRAQIMGALNERGLPAKAAEVAALDTGRKRTLYHARNSCAGTKLAKLITGAKRRFHFSSCPISKRNLNRK
jgi:hypothetical protein